MSASMPSVIKLLVQNIPPNINLDDFKNPFLDFNGLQDIKLLYNEQSNMSVGQIEFTNFECADQCKKFMQNYKFSPNLIKGLQIEFLPQSENMAHLQKIQHYDNFRQGSQPQIYNNINQQVQQPMHQNLQNNIQQQQTSGQNIALFKIPPNATNSLYVDGVPIDATEREIAHIFRPFPGFCTARLIKKSTKQGREFFLCFADFENSLQSTIAMDTLQGYYFDKNDTNGLKISFANESRDQKQSQQQSTGFSKKNY